MKGFCHIIHYYFTNQNSKNPLSSYQLKIPIKPAFPVHQNWSKFISQNFNKIQKFWSTHPHGL
ncbi:hypothetical protein ACS0TY_016926 [Phlomoides rotata]